MYAIVQVAVHDALNAIKRRSQPYAYDARVEAATSIRAAVAAAAHDALAGVIAGLPESPQCIANGLARVNADYAAALAEIPDGAAKSRGIRLGQASAAAILHLRASDGSNVPLLAFDYPQGTEPGEYRFTPPFDFTSLPTGPR